MPKKINFLKCFICSNTDIKTIYQKSKFQIFQCQKCYFAWLIPYPTEQMTKKIYSKDYFSDKNEDFYFLDAKKKLVEVKKFLSEGSKVLDFGCGLGYFLYCLKKENFLPTGYDISFYAKNYVKEKYQIQVKMEGINKNLFKKNYFDGIVCFDVLEHIVNFKEVINLFSFWLKKDGYLFITTPNVESLERKILGRYWYGYKKIPEHINYFSPQSIKIILEDNSFKVIKIKSFGFVRPLSFLLNQIGWRFIVKKFLFLKKIYLYLSLTDMLVVAKKK